MTSFSSSSHHKAIHFFFSALISILVVILVIDVSFSFILGHYLEKIRIDLKNSSDLELSEDSYYFEIFNGVLINGLTIKKKNSPIFSTDNIKLKLSLPALIFKKELSLERIKMLNPHIYKSDYPKDDILRAITHILEKPNALFKSTIILLTNLNVMETVVLDIDGYVALAQQELLLTRGKINIRKAEFLNTSNAPYINSILNKPINYLFEGRYSGDDFFINKLDLISHSARLLLSGELKTSNNTINLDIKGELKDFLLDDIQIINNSYLNSTGLLGASFVLKGPIGDIAYNIDIDILNCSLDILHKIAINKINSHLVWDNRGLRSTAASALFNNSPINLNLSIDNKGFSLINLEFLSQNQLDILKRVRLDFYGYIHNKFLEGDLITTLDYPKDKQLRSAALDFRDINFNFESFGFKSRLLNVLFNNSENWNSDSELKKMELSDLSCILALSKDVLSIQSINAKLYGGNLKAEVGFNYQEDIFSYNSKLNLENIQVKDLANEFLSSDYRLTGILSGKINIDSKENELIGGDLDIANGKIEDNAILIAVADFFSMPSLKNIDFSNLKILFRRIWDKFEAQINLTSDNVGLYLDNKFFPDGTMDGYLLAKFTTSLMDESKRFKALFKYIEYKEPKVYFPFKLMGYVNKPRIEWLRNEFKEKLQDFISKGNQKKLQDLLNKMVIDFSQ